MSLAILAAATICAVTATHDGDTIRCDGTKVRIANIDAPELPGSSRCRQLRTGANPSWCDYALGMRSRDALRAYLASGEVRIHPTGRRSYDRLVARVTVNGRDAGEYLVSRGLARPWR